MPHFFIKLIPPRPSFSKDMSESERAIMLEHAAYWKGLQNKGIALVYGPVLETKGVWGMGVVEAEDEAQAHGYIAQDPTIKARLHTVEIYPMMAVVKK